MKKKIVQVNYNKNYQIKSLVREKKIREISELLNGKENFLFDTSYDGIILHYLAQVKARNLLELAVKKCHTIGIINNLNKYGDTALLIAVYKNNPILVKALLNHGADVKPISQNEAHDTILHYSYISRIKNKEAQELLVQKVKEAGLLKVKNSIGFTPLTSAVDKGDKELVWLFLKYDAPIKIDKSSGGLRVDGVLVLEKEMKVIFAKYEEILVTKIKTANLKGTEINLILDTSDDSTDLMGVEDDDNEY